MKETLEEEIAKRESLERRGFDFGGSGIGVDIDIPKFLRRR